MIVRALVVDDCEDLREAIARQLQRAGYAVGAAGSVDGAHAALFQPDIIVSDFGLPDGSHEDVAKKWPGTPLVVISGYPRPVEYRGLWLTKPFTAAELLAAIDVALKEAV